MNEHGHVDRSAETSRARTLDERRIEELSIEKFSIYERIIPRVLRNILVVSVLLVAPAFWFYGWAGSIGFVFGAAVSWSATTNGAIRCAPPHNSPSRICVTCHP